MAENENQNEGTENEGANTGESGNTNTIAETGRKSGNSLDSILEKLDEDGRKAVRSELERARGDAAKYRTKANKFDGIDPERARIALEKLDEIEAASKSEADIAREKAIAAEKERDDARRELWRERVGRKYGLSDTFVGMVQGDTEDAMDEHAKAIADELNNVRKRPGDSVPGTPKSTQTPGAGESEAVDYKKIAADALAGL